MVKKERKKKKEKTNRGGERKKETEDEGEDVERMRRRKREECLRECLSHNEHLKSSGRFTSARLSPALDPRCSRFGVSLLGQSLSLLSSRP